MASLRGSRQVLWSFDRLAAKQAIYVDYEGRPYHDPVLLGQLTGDHVDATIVDPHCATCANRWRARNVQAADHVQTVRELLSTALRERRHIVSWSTHDLKLMLGVLDAVKAEQLLGCYVNALDVVRPWYRATHGHAMQGGNRLGHYRELFGLRVAPECGDGIVGLGLAGLQARLEAGDTYRDLDKADRDLWVAIVKHNACDLRHMREIVIEVTPAKGRGANR